MAVDKCQYKKKRVDNVKRKPVCMSVSQKWFYTQIHSKDQLSVESQSLLQEKLVSLHLFQQYSIIIKFVTDITLEPKIIRT